MKDLFDRNPLAVLAYRSANFTDLEIYDILNQ